MGRKIDSFPALLDLFRTFDDMPKSRADKCASLYELANSVNEGLIVELGTWHGIGAIALWHGARVPVVTVDSYSYLEDWVGNRAGDVELAKARGNFDKAGANVTLVIATFSDAADFLAKVPIGLLYWDAGTKTSHKDVMPFVPSIVVSGKVILHDTSVGTFNTDITGIHLERFGFKAQYEMPGQLYVSERFK